MTLALALPLGLLIGLVMGALGGGGAILAFPVFVYLLHQGVDAAQASSLVVVGVGALAGVLSALRHRTVRLAQGAVFGALGLVGNLVGTWLAHGLPKAVLMPLFAGLLLVVAVVMAKRLRSGRSSGAGALPLREAFATPRRVAVLLGAATATGALTGFFGVGGGFMIVPALVLALGFGIGEAAATSLLVIAINCLFAFVPRLVAGVHLDWGLTAALTAASVVGTVLGGSLGRRLPSRALNVAFIVLLLLIAAYTLVSTFA